MPHHLDAGENPTPQLFGLWSAISLGWLTLNVFGGVSFIMFVGLSAGGLPAILYGLYVVYKVLFRDKILTG